MPFITVAYPPKYPLTESEKKWLEEREKRGAYFCIHCSSGELEFPCMDSWNVPNDCPVEDAQDYEDAAKFEARVAAKLAIRDDFLTPCITDPNPETRGECKHFIRFYRYNTYQTYFGCAMCRRFYAILAVEAEMEK